MREARNEIEAWQQMAHALPPMSLKEKAEYGRGPGWVGLLIAIGLAVLAVFGMNFVK